MVYNSNPTYRYKQDGLMMQVISDNPRSGLRKRLIVSPKFVQLLHLLEENDWSTDLWMQLSQDEKNFLYDMNRKKVKSMTGGKIDSQKLEMEHLRESNELMNRMKLLEGSFMSGNYSDNVKEELFDIIDKLVDRHQLTKFVGGFIKKKIEKVSLS